MAEQTFNDYIIETRRNFVIDVNTQDWNTKLRCSAEELLIAFDQLFEKVKEYEKE